MTLFDAVTATPALLVDRDVLDRNIERMAESARTRGVTLRPHAKTHKSPDIARLQIAAGAAGLTVATVSEAEVFADHGFGDLFVAYPLWVDAARGARLAALAERTRVTVGVDSVEGARALATHAGTAIEVLVEVDSGHHRTGVAPGHAGAVAAAATAAGLTVAGVFTFPGHSYGPGRPGAAAAEESEALRTAADSLRGAGIEPGIVSGGSTPTAYLDTAATELRPGVYVFGDAQQLELGTVTEEEVALTVLATVVSARDGVVVLDAGSKSLGADRAPWATGYGLILGVPDARITALSEHHATVAWPAGPDVPRPDLGARLRVIPNHVCNAVSLADELIVTRGREVVDRWPVSARGCTV